MEPPSLVMPGVLDASGTVVTDIACRRCGYNVRGLNHLGRCPECGTPVGLSTQGDLLRFADPMWAEKVAGGANLIVWGLLTGIVGGLVGSVLAELSVVVGDLVAFGGGLLGMYGAWLLTAPDRGDLQKDRYVTARRIIRLSLGTALAGSLLQMISDSRPMPPTVQLAIVTAVAILGLAGVAGECATLHYLRRLASRIPDDQLARRAHVLMWAYTISYGLLALGGGIASVAQATGALQALGLTGALLGLGIALIGIGLAALVFSLLYIILLFRFRRALREQAWLARQSWAAVSSPGAAPPVLSAQ